MKLTGLDFETANSLHGSICSVGCAVLEDGIVTEKREWLVRPHKSLDYVTSACYNVHGISYYDLREAPEFPEIWPVLGGMLNTAEHVVIHNAPFDLGHLRAALTLYHLPAIRFPYVCSLAVSRRKHPELTSHSLGAMASFFDHEFQHHDALEDAIACAHILFMMKFEEKDVRLFDFHGEQ